MLDIVGLMEKLAVRRKLFHSEADFQHALAWQIHMANPSRQVRLEFNVFPDDERAMVLDIWLPAEEIAIELKYPRQQLDTVWNGERYVLKSGAPDIERYDYLNDIQRLERVVKEYGAKVGYAILLTNNRGFWESPRSGWKATGDAAFRIHEGRQLPGEMAWSEHASLGTTSGRKEPIRLSGSYEMQYRDYSTLRRATRNGKFRYVCVTVKGSRNPAA